MLLPPLPPSGCFPFNQIRVEAADSGNVHTVGTQMGDDRLKSTGRPGQASEQVGAAAGRLTAAGPGAPAAALQDLHLSAFIQPAPLLVQSLPGRDPETLLRTHLRFKTLHP